MALEFDDDNENIEDEKSVIDELSLSWVKFLSPETRKEIIQFVIDNTKMKKTELADILDVSVQSLYKFEKGEISPSDATIINALSALKPFQIAKLLEEIVIPQIKKAYDSALKDLEVVDVYAKKKMK